MKQDTVLVTAGRAPEANHGVVNPPVYHASTILFPTVAALEEAQRNRYEGTYYGRLGTPTTFALEQAVAAAEGGFRSIAVASGKAAVVAALTAFVEAGDHILMVDCAYGPTRAICDHMLARFGVETTYYDPALGAAIADLIRPNTRLVFTESPGSQTFEVQDIPAIAAAAHDSGCVVIMDNTWASPLYFKPFTHGVDVSVQAGTKYIVGHSDAMLGLITATQPAYRRLRAAAAELGACPGPDDCYLAQRGLRTLGVRLDRHMRTGLHLARWLADRAEVARVLHPGLPEDPGHALWSRDFTGASGLFGVVLEPVSKAAVAAMLDGLALFKMGYSWGGYESLIVPTNPAAIRTATQWRAPGPSLRIHAGLEDPDDLIADLEQGFARLAAAQSA
ncbi:MAG: cystathionine beta-lyase [Alphaproteobacteria bacterium]|jgi:cystathionine beta-lyase|nr:cystathionine beta-lyase [Alphaproteobacteria bacterium]MDP6516973.1 cystathionine beta-lyase [Alphaproteobacteria bacterium]